MITVFGNPALIIRAVEEEDAVKRSIQYQLSAIILMGLMLALTACVRPAPSSQGVDVAATSAAATAAFVATIPAIPTQPEGLVLPATATPPAVAPPTNTPEPVAQPTVTSGLVLPTTHTVQAGETAVSISAMYGVPVAEIMAANGIADPNLITVGQVLTIPAPGTVAVQPTAAPPPTSSGEQTYVVQPGDNLFRIGLNHGGFTAAELAAYNGIPNPTLIYPGQVIRIPPR